MKTIQAGLLGAFVVVAAGCASPPAGGEDAGTVDARASAIDAAAEPDAFVDGGENPPDPDVIAIEVTDADGDPPRKGDTLAVLMTVQNRSDGSGRVRLEPELTSARFAGLADLAVGSVELSLAPHQTINVTVAVEPFLVDDAASRRFALGRGDYTIPRVTVSGTGIGGVVDTEYTGGAFAIGASDVVFTAVVYDQQYLERIGWTGTVDEYLTSAFTRAGEVFTPSSPGSSNGTFQRFPGGFDEMMGIRQQFLAVDGLAASNEAGGFCEQIGSHARAVLGLGRDWDIDEGAGAYTDPDHHGFDILVGLTQAMGGGAACGWLGVQVSGLFDFDLSLDRSQIILVHEMGHIFGAPHCDPMQGYVMCSGEQHRHYIDDGLFVWHRVSRDVMRNLWE